MDECAKACCVGCIQGVCIACFATVFELCREIVCRPLCERCCNGCFDACTCCAGAKRKPRSYSYEEGSRHSYTNAGGGGGGGATYDPPVVTVVPMSVQPLTITTVAVDGSSGGAYSDLPTAYPAPADTHSGDVYHVAPVNHEMNRSVA